MTERIAEVEDVWVAWTNTDLNEGRGRQIPFAVCLSESTAHRLGKGKSVQGCNCTVTKEIAVKIEGRSNRTYAPSEIHYPSKEDDEHDRLVAEKRAAIEKAKQLGLSVSEIEAMQR